MKIEAELIDEGFQPACQVIDMRKAAVLNLHRCRCDWPKTCRLWSIVIPAIVRVVRAVIVLAEVWNNVRRVGVHDIVVVLPDGMSVAVADDMIVVVNVVAWRVIAVVVMLSVCGTGKQTCCQDAEWDRGSVHRTSLFRRLLPCVKMEDTATLPTAHRNEISSCNNIDNPKPRNRACRQVTFVPASASPSTDHDWPSNCHC